MRAPDDQLVDEAGGGPQDLAINTGHQGDRESPEHR
jgi:hypothetical protein